MSGGSPELPELDSYCTKILLYLAFKGEKIRFNELYEELKKHGLELSKPTLSRHLKHLCEEGLVIRKVEDVQVVSYQVNFEEIGKFKDFIQDIAKQYDEIIARLRKAKREFEAFPLDIQLGEIYRTMFWRYLGELKARIKVETDPMNFEKRLELFCWSSPYFRVLERWLIEQCKKDEKFREKVLQAITEDMEKWVKETLPSNSCSKGDEHG